MVMRSLRQDVRYGLRQFRKSPGFAVTVVAVLALGIGANIAVFTILNGILLRPLPFAHADRIVQIELAGPLRYIFGVQAHDGLTFAAVIFVLAGSAFAAAWLPARRAAAIDPILALRSE
jgi:ABC-type antimicrobial peptide transport system permease subunit